MRIIYLSKEIFTNPQKIFYLGGLILFLINLINFYLFILFKKTSVVDCGFAKPEVAWQNFRAQRPPVESATIV